MRLEAVIVKKKAIVIGAGQIGRGFIGERFDASGYQIVFMDAVQDLIDEINREKEYRVIILGEEDNNRMVRGVRAVSSLGEEAPREILDASVVTTAVGPNVIPKLAPMLAKAVQLRMKNNVTAPLDIIACENMDGASTKLYNSVVPLLSEEERKYLDQYVGFPDAEVSRIVVPIHAEKKLTVKVEKYMEWAIDSTKVKGDLSDVNGLNITPHVDAYVKRKIYTLTGHAILGYMGFQKGLNYIWQAASDEEIFTAAYRALYECGQAWSHQYQLPLEEFMEYSSYMLVRFADQRILDSCTRPCREPIRKLSATERFFGPALKAMEYGIRPVNIVNGIRAALKYSYEKDSEAVKLQQMIAEKGTAATLSEITGLPEDHELIRMSTED